jgi:hypothetical protein
MNREDVLRMAAKSNIALYGLGLPKEKFISHLENFAMLVAEHEREACADIAENWNSNGMPRTGVANEIRARGQA